jgi:protein with PEP-CTERM/exosortase system signal
MKIKYLAALITLAGLGLTLRADAAPLEMTYNNGSGVSSPNLLGTVLPGVLIPGQGQAERDATMTNQLIGMTTLGSQQTVNGSLFSRSFNSFGSLPTAVVAGNVIQSGTIGEGTTPVTVSLGTGFQYLVAAYDGPNGGVAVFNVAGLTGSVDLYRYAKPLANGNLVGSNTAQMGFFKMTGWTLLNPTGAVPDGGTTVMLLGAALGGLGMARRFLKI